MTKNSSQYIIFNMAKATPKISNEHSFTVLYEPLKNGGYQVEVPLLPGIVTYGPDFEQAREMARDAIVCYLEALKKEHGDIPNEQSLVHEQLTVTI